MVVSLTGETDAAAGFIYLLRPRWHRKSFRTASRFPMPTTHEQPDFTHAKSFVLCSFQPTKSACSAAAEKCLSGVGQPLSSVSGRQRYNTLDFARKVVCHETAGFIGFFLPGRLCPPLDSTRQSSAAAFGNHCQGNAVPFGILSQQGALSPIGNPEPKELPSLWNPSSF